MDFRAVLRLIIESFDRKNLHYGLIGGFALGVLGVPRATIDLDFLILRDDWRQADAIMKSNGYKCVYKSDEVAQYVSEISVFGEVDFLLAHRDISLGMLERASKKTLFSGEISIKVLRPEDIIGLKIQAIANDESRADKEYADIKLLMSYYKADLNWNLIDEYFKLFNLENKYKEFKDSYGNA
jgi:predicted nucleotidyltransferase